MFEILRGLIIGILCYYSINNEVYFFIILDRTPIPQNQPVLAKIPSSDACKAKGHSRWHHYCRRQMVAMIAWDSAKFGAYTIFCCTVPMIIHFSLVQVRYIFYHYYFWVMHLQCSSLQCHLEIHIFYMEFIIYVLFSSQMHFFNLLIDLTKGHQYMTVFLL